MVGSEIAGTLPVPQWSDQGSQKGNMVGSEIAGTLPVSDVQQISCQATKRRLFMFLYCEQTEADVLYLQTGHPPDAAQRPPF